MWLLLDLAEWPQAERAFKEKKFSTGCENNNKSTGKQHEETAMD